LEFFETEKVFIFFNPDRILKIVGNSPLKPGFFIRSVDSVFVVDSAALRQAFSPSTSVFPRQYHSANATDLSTYLPMTHLIKSLHPIHFVLWGFLCGLCFMVNHDF
jgi:hypothetical protein